MIRFGPLLKTDDTEALRRVIDAAAETAGRDRLAVEVLAPETNAVPPVAETYLWLDFHRIVSFDPAPKEDAGSPVEQATAVRRHLLDGYFLQPTDVVTAHLAAEGFRFPHDPRTLEVLGWWWGTRRPGRVTVLRPTTGEILHRPARPHPRTATGESDPPARLVSQVVGPSLRPEGRAAALDDLVSPDLGPIREETLEAGYPGLPTVRTVTSWHRGAKRQDCYGQDPHPETARRVARYEALERYQVAFRPAGARLRRASLDHFGGDASERVDPRDLFFGGSPDCPGDELPPFDPAEPLLWTPALDPLTNREAWVPAQEVWFDTVRRGEEPRRIFGTTNGVALGATFEDAALFALLEAVERDAFLTAWYLRRPARWLDPESLDDPTFQRLRKRWHHTYPGYRLRLLDLTCDTGVPVAGALAIRESGLGPKVFFGASARLFPVAAFRSVIEDMFGFRLDPDADFTSPPPRPIEAPSDHFRHYARDDALERLALWDLDAAPRLTLDALHDGPGLAEDARVDLRTVIIDLAEHLSSLGSRLLLRDLTHADLGRRGLHCVKALTPGLYPMWYGERRRRFRSTARLLKLREEWNSEGILDSAEFHLDIHPFS